MGKKNELSKLVCITTTNTYTVKTFEYKYNYHIYYNVWTSAGGFLNTLAFQRNRSNVF